MRRLFTLIICVVSIGAFALACRAAFASTAPGCQSGAKYTNGVLTGYLCRTISCVPPPCAAPPPPPGSSGYLQCYCGYGSPDNVCGRRMEYGPGWVADLGCQGPCTSPPNCKEDPVIVGGGVTEKWCACKP